METTNIYSTPPIDGRSDVATALRSNDTAMFLYDIEPGGASCPYHYEYVEEWLLAVAGEVTLRTPEGEHLLSAGTLTCLPAGPAGAHRILNRGPGTARVLLFSDRRTPAVSVYPDSQKIGVWPGDPADDGLIFRRDNAVSWSHGEDGWQVADPRDLTTANERDNVTDEHTTPTTLGSLHLIHGRGVVRLQDRIDTDINDLWSAITEPDRLERWLGDVQGELQVGGRFHAHFHAGGWDGDGVVEKCEAPRRLRVMMTGTGDTDENSIEITLTADGPNTLISWDEQVPPGLLPEYGAGIQIHLEDLTAYLHGGDRCDSDPRIQELLTAYEPLRPDVDAVQQ